MANRAGLPASTVGGYFAGSNLPPATAPGRLSAILRACDVTDVELIDQWASALHRIRRAPGPRPSDAPVPYRGLACYEPRDAEWYFGRESLTAILVARVEDMRGHGGVLAVVGPSGSGKSSLLRAGLVPATVADGMRSVFVPGERPVAEIDAFLDGRRPPMLVIDQFEEIFLTGITEAERDAFLDRLITLASNDRTVVVLGMRADVYATVLREPRLADILQNAQIVVGPMTGEELRQAIVRPVRKARLDIDDGLVELLLNEIEGHTGRTATPRAAHDAGALPLLSHALRATWQQCTRGRMTVADYRACGGISGAIAQTAETVFGALTPDEQQCARQVFLSLMRVAADTVETRRRVARDALPSGPHTEPVLERFIRQRLITADAGGLSISHDAVLHAWPRLRDWIDQSRGERIIGERLADAAESWAAGDGEPADLYRGTRLSGAVDWLDGHRDSAPQRIRAFVASSVRQERRRVRRLRQTIAALSALVLLCGAVGLVAVQQGAAARQARDLALSRLVAGRADRIRGTDVALAAQLSLAAYRIAPTAEARSSLLDSSAAFTATRLRTGGGVMQSVALSPRGLLAAGGADRNVRLWRMAETGSPGQPAAVLSGPQQTVYSVAFSPDGRILAVGSGDSTVRLWDVGDVRRPVPLGPPLRAPAAVVYSVAFSPDGRTLAAGSADRKVYLWDVHDPRRPRELHPLTGFASYVQAVTFSPDGRMLAAGSDDHTVRLWKIDDPQNAAPLGPALTGPSKRVYCVAFAPDSRTLAAGSADNRTRLWTIDPHGHAVPAGRPLSGATSWVNAVAFNHDGDMLATGSSDGTLRIRDTRTEETIARLPHPGPVTGVVFGPRDRYVITSAADGTARIWRLPGRVLTDIPDTVSMLSFRPDGRALAVGSTDTRIWGVPSTRPLGPPLTNPGRFATSIDYRPDGRMLAVGGRDGRLDLWDLTDPGGPRRLGSLRAHRLNIEDVTFAPDGHTLATSSDDTTVRLWNVSDSAHPRHLSTLTGYQSYVASVAFTADGRTLATGGIDGSVQLWDVHDPAQPRRLSTPLDNPRSYVYSVAFSPDGRTLATGNGDQTVRLWDVRDPSHPRMLGRPLTGPTNYVYSVALGDHGRLLAAADTAGTVWVWDIANRRHPVEFAELTAGHGALFTVVFAADGRTVASGGDARMVWLWNIDPAQVSHDICATAGDPITEAEWRTYIPGVAYSPPCVDPQS